MLERCAKKVNPSTPIRVFPAVAQ